MKIKINNEEVVCDKNFTVSEEMLATSSVTLNNVYPKSWEETKDYVSNFYYPKDYSICKIYDETIIPYEPGTEVSGNPLYLTDVVASKIYQYKLYGYTKQNGTPTPDNPIEVEVGVGKNILNFDDFLNTRGVTYTNDNGVYSITTWNQSLYSNPYPLNLESGKTYTLSQLYQAQGTTNLRLEILKNGTIIGRSYATDNTQLTTTFTADNSTYTIRVNYSNRAEPVIFNKPQLEKGGASSYLPYNTIEVKSIGKNLLKNISETQTINGITFTANQDGTISVSGTASSTAYLTYPTFSLSAGTYTLSAGIYVNQLTRIQLVEDITGRPLLASTQNAASQTFTTTATKSVFLQFRINSGEVINTTFKPMLEKSSTASEYEPYKETSIQYKLGDNFVADKDYIENGVLHKNIGKLVLNGSENWSNYTTQVDGYYKAYATSLKLGKTNNFEPTTFAKCNYFGIAGSQTQFNARSSSIGFTKNATYISIPTSVATTASTLKTWLQTQYNNGNPVVVYYELAEETTVDLETEGELSLYDGINNVSADTDFTIDMLYNRVNGETIEDIIFNGLVKRTGNISLNPRDPHYCSLQVLDFKTFLSEGDVLNFVIANKTIEQAINMVVKAISSYGFVVGNIELDAKDDIIGAYSTDEKTAYDVFQYIADITNAKWFTRMIDEETIAIDFYDTDKLPNKGLIEYTNEWFCQNKIDDMSYSMDTNDYRNKQIILSDEVFGSTDYNETITATGYTTQFLTGGKIAKLNGATINSQTATIATNEEKEAGIEADIYYTPGENQFETAETQAQGIVIEVSYTPLVKGREIVVNNEEVDRISSQLNRNGVISRYENRNDTTSSSELQQIGQSYIKYKGSPEITLKIVSRSNLYNVGDQVTFSSPLTELSTEYMVKKKSINYIATQSIIWYTFELSSNYNSESAINYFDNQRAKRAGNISESDYIIREIDINNSAQIKWKNTTITETTITGDNVLNAPLNAPLTQ